MPAFKSISDLNKYINSSAGQRNVLGGTDIKKIMLSEANRLKKCIQQRLDNYYSNYEPTVYNRTYQLQRSLQVDKNIIISFDDATLTIKLTFDKDSRDIGYSLFGSDTVSKALLINDGWQIRKNTWFKNIENFGYKKGVHFIEDGIADYNRNNPYGFKVEIEYL